MQVPEDLRYTEEHEWVRVGDDGATIGITDYAQDALGDIVYVDLPEVGTDVEMGEVVAEVESTKSVGEVYAPFAGTVVGVNASLADQPELINSSPFESGWILVMDPSDSSAIDGLLDAGAYRALTE